MCILIKGMEMPSEQYGKMVITTLYPNGNVAEYVGEAVPVVRCEDCKWWRKIDGGGDLKFCTYVIGADFVRKEDDYCSRGERKEGNV